MNGMKQVLWTKRNESMRMEKFTDMSIYTKMRGPVSMCMKTEWSIVMRIHMKTKKTTHMGQCTAMSTARRRKRQL